MQQPTVVQIIFASSSCFNFSFSSAKHWTVISCKLGSTLSWLPNRTEILKLNIKKIVKEMGDPTAHCNRNRFFWNFSPPKKWSNSPNFWLKPKSLLAMKSIQRLLSAHTRIRFRWSMRHCTANLHTNVVLPVPGPPWINWIVGIFLSNECTILR